MRCYALIYNSLYDDYTLIDQILSNIGNLIDDEKKYFEKIGMRNRYFLNGLSVDGNVLLRFLCNKGGFVDLFKLFKGLCSPIERRSFIVDTNSLFRLFSNTPMRQSGGHENRGRVVK